MSGGSSISAATPAEPLRLLLEIVVDHDHWCGYHLVSIVASLLGTENFYTLRPRIGGGSRPLVMELRSDDPVFELAPDAITPAVLIPSKRQQSSPAIWAP
jgi:hypothetical protein